MAWDSVPWFVGGGAQHSPEVARLLAYAAFGAREGVIGGTDLKVAALAVPGAAVRVAPGACAVLSRASGGAYQAYAGRLASEDVVPIAATGSGSGRSDLIVVRVEDPFMPGEPWSDPPDPTVGPYIATRVIADVPPTTRTVTELGLGYSAIPLARIDLPPSTGTITDAMITDLRQLVAVRRDRSVYATNLTESYSLTASSYVTWPAGATWSVAVPSWATRAIVRGTVAGVTVATGQSWGNLRVALGSAVSTPAPFDETIPAGTGTDRRVWRVADTMAIPAGLRGSTQTLRIEATRNAGGPAIVADDRTSVDIDIEFVETVQ